MTREIPLLSKSRFMAGLQCHKRLYLDCYHPDLADPVPESTQARFDTGTRVGELARDLYPGGVLIAENHLHHDAAMAATTQALSDNAVPALYEAGFLHNGVRMRADILSRSEGGFDLIEMKSTTQVKEEHLPDVAIQLYVLRGCGLPVRRACLGHLNKEYIYPGGDYDLWQLFAVEDITGEAEDMQSAIPGILDGIREALSSPEPPCIEAGRHCTRPYTCPFHGHCHENLPGHSVSQLPRAREELLEALAAAGIADIRQIPPGFPGLNPLQQRVRDCVADNRCYLDPRLRSELSGLRYPVHFLDFETFNPALPLYAGTRPFQVIPFQWSCHIMERDGVLRHEEFLHDGGGDPREAFARSLLGALGTAGSIVVYSAFEATRIRELAGALPALADRLLALLDDRIFDLLKSVRTHCYHPEFHGSFSLKSVLPALVPGLDYSDLEITEGEQASLAYAEMTHPDTPPERRNFLREALLAYCKRDTEAEVRLFNKLSNGKFDEH